jgi:Cu(I)-responsive transcriptional regulator
MTAKAMPIGILAQLTGTKVETIRFYEKIGLLPAPARTEGNYRSYESAHLNRLSFIRRARDLGFSIDQIRALLDLSDDKARSCAAVDAIAKEHLAEIRQKIADLRALQRELDQLITRCHAGTVAECRIIETLSPRRSGAAVPGTHA